MRPTSESQHYINDKLAAEMLCACVGVLGVSVCDLG